MKDAKVLSFAGACGVIAGVLLLVAKPPLPGKWVRRPRLGMRLGFPRLLE